MLVAKAYQRPDPPRTMKEAKVLQDNGYSVHVIAWDRYGEFPAIDNMGGVTVHSFTPVNLRRFSKAGLALGGILFQALLLFETVKLVGELRQRPIVHAHDINTLPVGSLLRLLRLCSALVYDCREFTYGVYYEWFNVLVASVVRAFEEACLRYVKVIITISDPIADYLRRFNRRVEIIYNCPSMAEVPKLSKQEARIKLGLPLNVFLVSSVGAIRHDCRYDLLLAVASATGNDNVHYLVVGNGPQASDIRRALTELDNRRISMVKRVPRETAMSYVLASDLTWAVYQNRAESLNPRMTIPWKFFESIACGVPVLVESGTFRANMVERFKCGVVLTGEDPSDVAQVVTSIANNIDWHLELCSNARKATREMNLTWEAMSAKLVKVYQDLFESQLPQENAAGPSLDRFQRIRASHNIRK
jgi:glycosyltransferase involved in cell wall biosynthesis